MGVSFQSPTEDQEDWWFARAIRSRMLENGVWGISDKEVNIRLYPALNMDEAVLRDGLARMEEAISHVERHGQDIGDSPLLPTGS
jgi:acetylornithine/succinyldiaminopimelate/putrescine aminotransferase